MIAQEATLRYYFPQIEEKRYKAGTFWGSLSSLRAAGNGLLIRRQGGAVLRVLAVLNHTYGFSGTEVFDVSLQKIGDLLCYGVSKLMTKQLSLPLVVSLS